MALFQGSGIEKREGNWELIPNISIVEHRVCRGICPDLSGLGDTGGVDRQRFHPGVRHSLRDCSYCCLVSKCRCLKAALWERRKRRRQVRSVALFPKVLRGLLSLIISASQRIPRRIHKQMLDCTEQAD